MLGGYDISQNRGNWNRERKWGDADYSLWERDVYRIFLVVFTGDEELLRQAWELCALADGIGP